MKNVVSKTGKKSIVYVVKRITENCKNNGKISSSMTKIDRHN